VDLTHKLVFKTIVAMQNKEEFRKRAREAIEWIANYYENIESYPVKSQVKPGEILEQLPDAMPSKGEDIPRIMEDFDQLLLQGITHWQSPRFFAYFPANTSLPSLIAEMMTAAMGVQGMKWETSPAAAELEEQVMEWLKSAIGLPGDFQGTIQDSASTATLVSILTAREKKSGYDINERGLYGQPVFRVYCSQETHSSIERAVKVAGLGRQNLVKIPVDDSFRMQSDQLESAIEADIRSGYTPLCIVATLGTTGSTSIDPLSSIARVADKHDLWLHVDAAYAGSALILPEYRWMIGGIESVDTLVFNPHKWLFTNFDCSAYFVRDKKALTNTFQLIPEYLKTRSDEQVNNYSDWTIPLGRRFRALKLWFVLRYYGLEGLQQKLRDHIQMARQAKEWIEQDEHFEMLAPLTLNVLCFRYHPPHIEADEKLNALNERLLNSINQHGRIYLTHTKLDGRYTLRLVIAQTHVEQRHVEEAWREIKHRAEELSMGFE